MARIKQSVRKNARKKNLHVSPMVSGSDYIQDRRRWGRNNQYSLLIEKYPRCDDSSHISKREFELTLWDQVWSAAVHGEVLDNKMINKKAMADHLFKLSNVLLFKSHFPIYPQFNLENNEQCD